MLRLLKGVVVEEQEIQLVARDLKSPVCSNNESDQKLKIQKSDRINDLDTSSKCAGPSCNRVAIVGLQENVDHTSVCNTELNIMKRVELLWIFTPCLRVRVKNVR